jgi:tetratricopeptide (TPR) repeat protein
MGSHFRFSRKNLKAPDQFVSTTTRFLGFFKQNERILIFSATAVCIVAGIAWTVDYNRRTQELRMENLLFEMRTIQEKGGDIGKLKEFLDRFDEGERKRRARLMIADAFYRNSQYAEAVKLYAEVVETSRAGEMSRDAARIGLAYSHEAAREYKKAIDAYKSIIDQGGAASLFDVYFSLARVYAEDRDTKNALLILREMENKFQGDARLDKIREKIKRLAAQG